MNILLHSAVFCIDFLFHCRYKTTRATHYSQPFNSFVFFMNSFHVWNWIGATLVRLTNGLCIYSIRTGHFHRPKSTTGHRQSFAENSFASKNSICARQHSHVHFSMWPWIKAASFVAFLFLTANAKRGVSHSFCHSFDCKCVVFYST